MTLAPPSDANAVDSEVIFSVGNCRAAHRLLQLRGAPFLTDPYDSGPEVGAFFRDPDGHLFEISERPG